MTSERVAFAVKVEIPPGARVALAIASMRIASASTRDWLGLTRLCWGLAEPEHEPEAQHAAAGADLDGDRRDGAGDAQVAAALAPGELDGRARENGAAAGARAEGLHLHDTSVARDEGTGQ